MKNKETRKEKRLLKCLLVFCIFFSFLISSTQVVSAVDTDIVDIDENGEYIYYEDIYKSLLTKGSSIPNSVKGLGHFSCDYKIECFYDASLYNTSYELAESNFLEQNPQIKDMNWYYAGFVRFIGKAGQPNYGMLTVQVTFIASPTPINIFYSRQGASTSPSTLINIYSLANGFYMVSNSSFYWDMSKTTVELKKDLYNKKYGSASKYETYDLSHDVRMNDDFKYVYGSTMSNAFYGEYSIQPGSIGPPILPPIEPDFVPVCATSQIPTETNEFYYLDNLPTITENQEFKKVCKHENKEVFQLLDKPTLPPSPEEPGGGDAGWLQPLFDFFTNLISPLLNAVSNVAQSVLNGIGNITIPLNYDQLPEQIKSQVQQPKERFSLVLVPIGLLVIFILGGVTGLLDFSKLTIPIQNFIDYFFKKINDPMSPTGTMNTATQFGLDIRNTFNNLFGGLTSLPTLIKNFMDTVGSTINQSIKGAIGVDISSMLKIFEDAKKFVESIPTHLVDIRDSVLGIPVSIGIAVGGAIGDIIDDSPLLSSIRDAVLGIPLTLVNIKDSVLGIPNLLQQLLDKFLELLKGFNIASLVAAFQELLKALFIPNTVTLTATFNGFKNRLYLKLPILSDIALLLSSLLSTIFDNYGDLPPKLTFKIPKELGLGTEEYTLIDWQFYEQYRVLNHMTILFISYAFFLIKLPKKLSSVLGGIH